MGVGNAIVLDPMDCFKRNPPITPLERYLPDIEALRLLVFEAEEACYNNLQRGACERESSKKGMQGTLT